MPSSKNIIVGIGNDILGDDGIGIYVAKRLENMPPDTDVVHTSRTGLYLMELTIGYDRAVFIDAMVTGRLAVGTVSLFETDDMDLNRPFCRHVADFAWAVHSARTCGLRPPSHIVLIGIEVRDVTSFSAHFSPEVEVLKYDICTEVNRLLARILAPSDPGGDGLLVSRACP